MFPFFTQWPPKGPFRIYDLGDGGFGPDGRAKTKAPLKTWSDFTTTPKNVSRILLPPLKSVTENKYPLKQTLI